jgi:glycerol-1-phosphate dehydrogenase [NAD(P)+]
VSSSETTTLEKDRLLLDRALQSATQTRSLRFNRGALRETAALFRREFGDRPALIVADTNTFEAAGKTATDTLSRAGQAIRPPLVFDEPGFHAESPHVQTIENRLTGNDAIPVAVGSGTINDLVKLASHRAGRPYMVVATAASMDGYTAFGASITHQGSKQTFECPAPRAVVADLDVICAAPTELSASGYADLLAKIPAGADWIAAESLGVEPIDPLAWTMVQQPLREWLDSPSDVRAGKPETISHLVAGLLVSGFAMQWTKSSRAASGSEHQFSHLWDMEHHTHLGKSPSHGFKVGIGSLASTALYEELFELPLEELDADRCCSNWLDLEDELRSLRTLFDIPEIADKGCLETRIKHPDRHALKDHLTSLRRVWPELRRKLRRQLVPRGDLRDMLAAAGAPCEPEDIGMPRARLRASYLQAYHIRRRYTVFDLARRAGVLDQCLDRIFGSDGPWPVAETVSAERNAR